jgi:hypothetical protein
MKMRGFLLGLKRINETVSPFCTSRRRTSALPPRRCDAEGSSALRKKALLAA